MAVRTREHRGGVAVRRPRKGHDKTRVRVREVESNFSRRMRTDNVEEDERNALNRWVEQSERDERSGIIIPAASGARGVRTEVSGSTGTEFGGQQVGEKGNRSIGGDIMTDQDNLFKPISELVMDTLDKALETATSYFATEQRQDCSLRQYWNLAQAGSKEWIVEEGLLYRTSPENRNSQHDKLLVVPSRFRMYVLDQGHPLMVERHSGRRKTFLRITAVLWWPRISEDVGKYCKSCEMSNESDA